LVGKDDAMQTTEQTQTVTIREGALTWRYQLPRAEALRLARRMRRTGREVEVSR
jgi:hypothetical protein